MRNSVCSLFIVIGILANVSNAQVVDIKRFTDPSLKEGQCHTLVDSKVYLATIKNPAQVQSVSHIVEDLGEEYLSHFNNTDTESYFFCKVKCHLNSESQFIWISTKDKNEKMKTDINAFVCPGLSIEDVPASPTLSIKTTVPMIFEAVQSGFPEVHFRLRNISYKLTGSGLNEMIVSFYNVLKVVQGAYSSAQLPVFQEAAAEMALYFPESPDSWNLAKNKAAQVGAQGLNSTKSILDIKNGSDLVDLFFMSNGRFLQYLD